MFSQEIGTSRSLLELLEEKRSQRRNYENKNFITIYDARQVVTRNRIFNWSTEYPLCQAHKMECPDKANLVDDILKNNILVFAVLVFARLELLMEKLLKNKSDDRMLFHDPHFQEICRSAGLSDAEEMRFDDHRSSVGVIFSNQRILSLSQKATLPFVSRERKANGSYGDIFRIQLPATNPRAQPNADDIIAEKHIRPDSSLSDQGWDRLYDEVKALQHRRNHPNIIALLASYLLFIDESGIPVRTLHLLFPWAECNLAEWMYRRENPSNVEALAEDQHVGLLYRCIYGLVSGLAYLHRDVKGFFTSHHDLKPRNILWVNNELQIADLGMARLRSSTGVSETEGVSGLGSYEYQPPEYWNQNGSRADTKHGRPFDVWSMGCILLDLAILLVHGWAPGMVMKFRNDRRSNPNRDRKIPSSVHDGDETSFHNNQTITTAWISQLKDVDHSQRFNEVLGIVSKMLAPLAKNRPYIWEVELDLHEILTPEYGMIPESLNSSCAPPPLKKYLQHDLSLPPDIDQFTETPLHRAARKDNFERTLWLWKLGWPLFIKDPDGRTPLEIMKSSKNPKLSELEDSVTRMLGAAKKGDIEQLREFFNAGLSPLMSDINGTFAIHNAIASRKIDTVNFLLERDAGIQVEIWDQTCQELPLHKAARIGFAEALERMLQEGPTVDQQREFGSGITPLYCAAERHHLEAVKVLLKHGAKVLVPELETRPLTMTPLHVAIACVSDGMTVDGGMDAREEIVESLLQADDGPRCVNRRDALETPALSAASHGLKGCVRLLLRYGALTDAIGPGGMTLLHCFARRGWHDLLQEHIDRFSSEQLQALWVGMGTPLEIAKRYRHDDVVRLLESRLPKDHNRVIQYLRRKLS